MTRSKQSFFGSRKSTRRHNRESGGAGKSSFTPRMEGLEDRALLSAISVVNTADSGPGSLRQAITDANDAAGEDVISFAKGVRGTITLTGGELSIIDDLIIDGPSSGQVRISGNDASRVFGIYNNPGTGEPTDVAIDDLTITDGRTDELGGAILHTGGELRLTDVTLSHNQVVGSAAGGSHGGAIANLGTKLAVTDSAFQHNLALGEDGAGATGGAIWSVGTHGMLEYSPLF